MAYYFQGSASAQIKPSQGRLIGLVFSSTSSGTIVVYDSPDGDTNDPKIINTLTPAAGTAMFFGPGGIQFNKGLYVAVSATLEFTVIYE